jgi:hypothetical protein
MSKRKIIEAEIVKKSDVTLYDISFTLKGTKTLKEIFAEAERLYPENEEAQCRHAAAVMKEIGFTVSTKISGS